MWRFQLSHYTEINELLKIDFWNEQRVHSSSTSNWGGVLTAFRNLTLLVWLIFVPGSRLANVRVWEVYNLAMYSVEIHRRLWCTGRYFHFRDAYKYSFVCYRCGWSGIDTVRPTNKVYPTSLKSRCLIRVSYSLQLLSDWYWTVHW